MNNNKYLLMFVEIEYLLMMIIFKTVISNKYYFFFDNTISIQLIIETLIPQNYILLYTKKFNCLIIF